jgi:hypothetical protein
MKKIIFLVVIVLLGAYLFYPEKTITYPPGITAPEIPMQTNLSEEKIWLIKDYTVTALAGYKIKARVLSRNNFSVGKESDLSPFDLALGWGPMSDQSVIDKIDISQSNRWYRWKAANPPPIPTSEIMLNSANVHIVPIDYLVEDKFDDVYKGSLIEMQGYLVKITAEGGWKWISSLKREDTGGGSCELFLVEEVTILDSPD